MGYQTILLPLELRGGHLVTKLCKSLCLVDTGSPLTLGRRELPFGLAPVHLGLASNEVLDSVRENTGIDADFLLGCDVLEQYTVTFDLIDGHLELGEVLAPPRDSSTIDLILGLPAIQIRHAGAEHRAFLDSGAHLSYAPPGSVAPIHYRYRDFHPFTGAFDVDVGRIDVYVGTRAVSLRVGALPPALQLLAAPTKGWIVGTEYFANRRIQLSLRERWVADVT